MMNPKEFLDLCYFIATKSTKSRHISFENDICVKTGITSFANSMEYRDDYILISSSLSDSAIYVEMINPYNKVLFFIDGRGKMVVFESDFQYLADYVKLLYNALVQ